MGDVYRATDEVLGRDVAVKLMLPVPGTLAASGRFLREARAAARIRDPHVVAAFDFGDEDGCCFLAMELVGDRTVGEELRREGLFPRTGPSASSGRPRPDWRPLTGRGSCTGTSSPATCCWPATGR